MYLPTLHYRPHSCVYKKHVQKDCFLVFFLPLHMKFIVQLKNSSINGIILYAYKLFLSTFLLHKMSFLKTGTIVSVSGMDLKCASTATGGWNNSDKHLDNWLVCVTFDRFGAWLDFIKKLWWTLMSTNSLWFLLSCEMTYCFDMGRMGRIIHSSITEHYLVQPPDQRMFYYNFK